MFNTVKSDKLCLAFCGDSCDCAAGERLKEYERLVHNLKTLDEAPKKKPEKEKIKASIIYSKEAKIDNVNEALKANGVKICNFCTLSNMTIIGTEPTDFCEVCDCFDSNEDIATVEKIAGAFNNWYSFKFSSKND